MNVNHKLKLGEILLNHNIISQRELDFVLEIQKEANLRLGELLLREGIITEDNITFALSEYYGMQYQKKLDFHDPEHVLKNIPVHFLRKNKLAPFNVVKKIILVALSDALNIHPFDDLNMLLPGYTFEPVLTSEEEISKIINKHFEKEDTSSADDVIDEFDEDDYELLGAHIQETEDILDMANDAPIIKLVNKIITQAVNERASDIHFEPYEKDLVIRYRIDGILYEKYTPPKKIQSAIISRIKIMSNLNIAENRLPQDGRIQIKIGNKDIDIRVSIFPTYYGERIVLRLLNKTDMNFNLESLGFDKNTFSKFNDVIDIPHGIILVTGPTGSGKSTTLYSVLTKINSPDINILTVENPIEYQLHGIGQMQVRTKIDLTFAAGLRSILRQDPDVIMVGEIRDVETAEIAVQSALTGHRVLSTIHTNDAASAVTRLIDMGVEPFLIASSVNAFLAQRLVRKICTNCKKSYKPTAKELKDLGLTPSKSKNIKFYAGKGCEKCLNTGYQGRTGIYELLEITSEIRKLVLNKSDSENIKNQARKQGMKTLFEDGLEKAKQGITTIEEILRVSI